MIRVLIVDDSATLRRLIRAILESDPELEVVGEARDGEEAIALCRRLQPDIVTTDIQMPKLDGYEVICNIMAESPRPIVVLTSSMSDRELGISFKAVEAGALMVIGKPHGLPGKDPDADRLIDEVKLMSQVKVVGRRRELRKEAARAVPGQIPDQPRRSARGGTDPEPLRLIAIGASTGGPLALRVILAGLQPELSPPIVAVQHISPGFVHGMARWLDNTTPFSVKVAGNGAPLQPGAVCLAPDDKHLLVSDSGVGWFSDSPPVDGHRPSATALLKSVAQTYGPAAVGVLLTGMGKDGARGLKTLRDAGARTIAQDEATCVVFGMPGEAIALGAAQEVLPLDRIAARLTELVRVKA